METKKYRSIWISDTHLGTYGSKARYLADFLKKNDSDKLYLVGDIIDIWRMKKSGLYWPQEHSNVLRRILTRAKRGTQVIYITGNHDEFLRKWTNFDLIIGNITIVNEIIHTTPQGEKYLVVHGDIFDLVTRYHKWIAFLGDSAYTFLIFINIGFNKIREKIGFGYWSLSAYIKNKVKSAMSFITEFEDLVANEVKKRDLDGVICGHIHHASINRINEIKYFNCGDWVESCTALVEDFEGNIKIVTWVEIDHKTKK